MITSLFQATFELVYPLVVLLFLLLIIAHQGERVSKIAGYEQAISFKSRQFLWPWLYRSVAWMVWVIYSLLEYLFDSVLSRLESVSKLFDRIENHFNIDLDTEVQPLSLIGPAGVTDVDAEKVADLAVQIWGETRFSRSDRIATYQDWLAHDPDCIKWIIPPGTNKPIGFTCFFALKQEIFNRFQRGRMSQRTFEGADFETNRPGNVFIQAVALQKSALLGFPNRKNLSSFVHSHILEHMAIFARRALPGKTTFVEQDLAALPVVCADICEPAGEKMARHYTFKEHAQNTIDKTKIFLLEPAKFCDPNEPPDRGHQLRKFIAYLNGKPRPAIDVTEQIAAARRSRVWWKMLVFGVNVVTLLLGAALFTCLAYRIYVWGASVLGPFVSNSSP